MKTAPLPTQNTLPQKRYRTWPITILGLILLGLTVLFIKYLISNQPKPKPAQSNPQVTMVNVTPVVLTNNQVTIKAQGFVKPKWQSRLSSQVNGKIKEINPLFEVGNIIEKDSLLIRLDDSDYLAALASAKSSLAQAKTTLATELAQAKQAKRDLKRAGVTATSLALRKPQITQAKASLANAQAQVTLAKKNISRTTIKTPFKSLVLTRGTSLDELASVGSQIADLVSLDAFSVEIALSEKEISLIQQQTSPTVVINDPTTNGEWTSNITRFAASIDTNNRTLIAYADIENPYANPSQLLRLESFVNTRIAGNQFEQSMWIANTAIVNNQFIWQLTNNNTLDKSDIEIIYSHQGQSLVRFKTPVVTLVNTPLSSFTIGKTVSVAKPAKIPSKQHPKETDQDSKTNDE